MSADPPAVPAVPAVPGVPAGPDLARQMLEQARAERRRTPTDEERAAAAVRRAEIRRGGRRRRPAGDPVTFRAAIDALLAARGWQTEIKVHEVVARWDEIAGPEIASRCQPAGLHDGELVLVAESTAWATQLRLLNGQIRGRIDAVLGPGVVRVLRVHGPAAAKQAPGRWRVGGGRGPRDTYG